MVTDDSLHGRAVLTNDGVKIGELEHLLLDPQQLRLSALQVRIRKDVAERLGIPHGLLRGTSLEIPIEQVQSVGDAVLLSIHGEALRRTEANQSPADTSTSHP